MRASGFGIKAATITPEGKDDVGSPNRILREGIDGKVIIRTGRRIPGVMPFGGDLPPDLGRAHGRRRRLRRRAVARGRGGLRRRGRLPHRAHHARRPARRWPSTRSAPPRRWAARSTAGPKWTVSPVYEGMLKEEMDAAAARHPDVVYEPVLIDATYAGLITGAGEQPAGDPRAQPRRRLPVGPRDADVRLDRRRGVGAAVLRRRPADAGGDGRGAARHRAGAAGQGRRQPDGDDPRRAARCSATPAAPGHRRRRARRRGRSTRRCSRRSAPGCARPDLGGHSTTTEIHPARSSTACAPSSRCGPRWAPSR